MMADMTPQEALAPCPFCGSDNVDPQAVLGERGDGTPFSEPGCLDCDATTRSVGAWNTRQPSDERDNQIAGLLAVLRKHHQWHDTFRSYYVKTVDDEFVEIDNADGYADSDLASETTDALWLRFRQPVDGFAAHDNALVEALEFIAEEHDAGRHDGLPEPCPAHDAVTMWAFARQALTTHRENGS